MRKLFGGGVVAGVLATLLFMGGMVSAGAFGDEGTDVPSDGSVGTHAVGTPPPESGYTAVEPCRLFDTRKVAAGAFENESRNFDAVGNVAAQGGKSGGCGIPAYANSIVITITGVTPTGKGFMRGEAFDGVPGLPQATQLNYAPGIDASNTLTLPISQGLSKEFTLATFGNRVHLVGDVLGYFADPFYALVEGEGTSASFQAENRFATVTRTGTGVYELTVDAGQDIRGCAIIVGVSNSDTDDFADSDSRAGLDDVETDGVTFTVNTTDDTGALRNEDFTVAIHC